MNTLTTSTLAALEEMLQNTARPAPPDFLPIQLIANNAVSQTIGHLNPEFISYLQETLANHPIDLVSIGADQVNITLRRPKELSESLYQLAQRMRLGGFIPGWRNEDFAYI